jgi:hypothetical protein
MESSTSCSKVLSGGFETFENCFIKIEAAKTFKEAHE